MRKILFTIFFLLFSVTFASEEPIKANIQYDEAQAKIEAFNDVLYEIDKDVLKDFRKDKNRKENLEFIEKNIQETNLGRYLCPFYLKNTLATYAVVYDSNPEFNFYYNILGNLVKFDIVVENNQYRKIVGYSRNGKLISVAFEVNEDEQFVYDDNGKLVAHWKNDRILNKNNKIPKILKLRRGVKKSK